MQLENKDFYPTPEHLIQKLVNTINFKKIRTILEPSAGAGAIADYLKDHKNNDYYNYEIDCIEIEPDLIATLKGKGHRVVFNDFLSFNTFKEYDLILANFPFSNGCKHLLKAIELQERNGGAIACIINAETLRNQCSNDRIFLSKKLKELNADIEFIENAFSSADRKTSVEIALIKVQLPERKKTSFIWEKLQKKELYKEVNLEQKYFLADNDFLHSIVTQYNMEVEAGIALIKEYHALKNHILANFSKDEETGKPKQDGCCILNLSLSSDAGSSQISINDFIKDVRKKYWTALFKNEKFTGKLTSNLKRDYQNQIQELASYDFSVQNIYEIKECIFNNMFSSINETILTLFDEFSRKYSYYGETSANIHYYNGWKTNKSYIVNNKIILPLNGYSQFWNKFDPDWRVAEKLTDIEKCFSYLDTGKTETAGESVYYILRKAAELQKTKKIQLKYFEVTFYKKGTCHITFYPQYEILLKKFNIFGSQKRGWLPYEYGNKRYEDMSPEEQNVINEFDGGEKEYSAVFQNKEFYLVNTVPLLKFAV